MLTVSLTEEYDYLPPKGDYPVYDTKLHLVVRLKFFRFREYEVLSLPLLPGPLWLEVIVPKVTFMDQTDLFKIIWIR